MSVTVTSKIKSMLNDELLRYTAAICDTRRIESNMDKMITLGNLLHTYGIEFEILGGATNRIALQIDGYAVKFAMDEQGYQDNLIEYSLSPELQPYVTKTYETNGYVLVAECVEVMTVEKFELYKIEIRKILDALCQDYLLGDVGYIKKNMTNWGLRGTSPVILDYAYCHRATENLFTCSRCGSALRYDSTYDVLLCSDRSGCKARYTYNERKRIQGKEVDIKMIAERKSDSIKLPKGIKSKTIEMFEDRLVGDNYFVIDNPGDLRRYEKLKEELSMNIFLNGGEDMGVLSDNLSAMVALAKNPNDEEAKNVLYQSLSEDTSAPEPIYTENYQERYLFGPRMPMRVYEGIKSEEEQSDQYEEDDSFDMEGGLSALISQSREAQEEVERQYEEARRSQEERYLDSLNARKAAVVRQAEPKQADGDEPADEEVKEDVEVVADTVEEPETDAEEAVDVSGSDSKKILTETETGGIFVNGKPIEVGEEVTVNG